MNTRTYEPVKYDDGIVARRPKKWLAAQQKVQNKRLCEAGGDAIKLALPVDSRFEAQPFSGIRRQFTKRPHAGGKPPRAVRSSRGEVWQSMAACAASLRAQKWGSPDASCIGRAIRVGREIAGRRLFFAEAA